MPKLASSPRWVEVRSAVEQIAAFALSARPEHLRSDIRQLLKRNILDSLGCAIAGLQGKPFEALRAQFEEYRAPGRCTLIGGGKSSADQAALFNSGLVRYVDLLDSYMAIGGLCHPSDNFGTILAAAEQAGASGEEFMLALAVAYEIQCRFTAAVPVMAKGFNHAIQLAISAATGAGKLDICPDERFSARYPHELSARVTIHTKGRRVFEKEQNGYEGGLTNPMSWERTVEKFHWLAEAFADEELRERIIGAVERLDTSELSDLTELLAEVQPSAIFRTAHPGIQ